MPETIILATTNPHKLREYRALLGGLPIKLILPPQSLPVKETGKTFTANAKLKAQAYGRFFNSPILADDTGLCVQALHGQPGILSHRFARSGFPAARKKILNQLIGLPQSQRQAYFFCALAYFDPQTRKTVIYTGKADGYIALKEIGKRGFGYDSIFYSPKLKKTFAQAPLKEKNQFGHRGLAFKKFIAARIASKTKAINPVLRKS